MELTHCKQNEQFIKDDLIHLTKEELIDKLLIANAHNNQLRNIIKKQKTQSAVTLRKNSHKTKRNKHFDFTKCNFRHILLHFYYLGWDYQGFVVQEDTTNTIEYYLFEALIKTCLIKNRETCNYHRCGRTDKGVSSFGQVISLNVRSKLNLKNEENATNSNCMNELNYCKILNSVLPDNIRCVAWCPVPDDFSARFNCKSRTYKYFFPRSNLNISAMEKSLPYLVGVHDFRNLCKMDVGNGVITFTRNIISATIEKCKQHDLDLNVDMYVLTIKGQAFLWHQIRCIIAVLFLIGENKEEPEIIRQLLDIEKCPRKPNYNLAKDFPLNLFHCEYDTVSSDWIYDQANIKHVICTLHKQWTCTAIKSTMIQTMLDQLQKIYYNYNKCGDKNVLLTNCLVQGVDSKIYKPLMSRQKCNALNDRIEHYAKKKKNIS